MSERRVAATDERRKNFFFDASSFFMVGPFLAFSRKNAENKEKTSVFTEVSSWFRLELNQRHADFQSTALPTELQNHFGDPIIDYFFQLVKGKENITVIFLKKLLNLEVLDGIIGFP